MSPKLRNLGSKREREELRRQMLNQGFSVRDISIEMSRRWYLRPRAAFRHANGFSQDELADRCNDALADPAARISGKRISDYENWPSGGSKPTVSTLLIIASVLKAEISDLVDTQDRQHFSADDLSLIQGIERTILGEKAPGAGAPQARRTESGLDEARPVNRSGDKTLRNLVMAAAEDSSRHVEKAEVSHVEDLTITELNDEVDRIARVFLHADPVPAFGEMIRLRDRAYRLLERRQYPRQTNDLYFAVGKLSCLLGDASNNFGFKEAASEQFRAAWAYGQIIGDSSLQAWVRGAQSFAAFTADRPRESARLAESGLSIAANPGARLRLHSLRGLALAADGDREGTLHALRLGAAERERADGSDGLSERVRGMFSCTEAKQEYYAATALNLIREPLNAESHAMRAIALYEQGPIEERAYGNEAVARVDVSTARLALGDLSGAASALEPILSLSNSRRVDWLRPRLQIVRGQLANARYRRSRDGIDLADRIEDFTTDLAGRSLPGKNL
ncbi:hypothetical protein GCM10010472_28740 [Pseudonocardia halophobica]|uniref:HTH cro/C1-type domain-containing protein n=1 Tax=Pseudonocardia halophobica TaxID=29401 RepID=A0A9W6NU15_9PSEU|nr:helix-turn-helix transcriptional regulator [Pseudonocardia halophobica]GLL09133.1 hypothetical protein GCM10017577_02730 [Pseudonocardia halophobica]